MSLRGPTLLVALAGALLGVSSCPPNAPPGSVLVQELVTLPGFPEPHTPGSGAPEELPTPPVVTALLGPGADLNRVTYLRTYLDRPGRARPHAIVILVPGFLGGASTFGPLARQLVLREEGSLEVWAIDRRPNQLEDLRGADHVLANVPAINDFATFLFISEGLRYYFKETPFSDINLNGVLDPQFELPDAQGVPGPYRKITQEDMRYAAHWGVDTYVRDWKILVDRAREIVGKRGLVIFGGHSMGTTWAGTFAAYDFDPGPGVDAGYEAIDGLLLLEGGGVGTGSTTVDLTPAPVDRPSDAAEYETIVASLESAGGPDVFLESANGLEPATLGPGAVMAAIAADFLGSIFSSVQLTPLFKKFPLNFFFATPMTNRAIIALFVDDDFQPFTAFRASVGFTDDGPNSYQPAVPGAGIADEIYFADPVPGHFRTWKDIHEPMPTCPPNDETVSPGCAIQDNGPRPGPTDSPATWGVEREVTDLDDLIDLQYQGGNFIEWYFVTGRISVDLAFGRDSSALGDESLLAITRNADVDVPVLAIGASNGLAPSEASFASYLGSIATPPEDEEIDIVEGYAHLDVLTAADNEAVPLIASWIERVAREKPGRRVGWEKP